MNPIVGLCITMEKYKSNLPLHFLFLGMQKAFDCGPCLVITSSHQESEAERGAGGDIDIIRDLDIESIVWSAVGDTILQHRYY